LPYEITADSRLKRIGHKYSKKYLMGKNFVCEWASNIKDAIDKIFIYNSSEKLIKKLKE
jgi:hypothetical protein